MLDSLILCYCNDGRVITNACYLWHFIYATLVQYCSRVYMFMFMFTMVIP